jgi:hypothetical protein
MKPWGKLRMLDLASLEGIFAIEFASQGAEIVAIEGREANNARASPPKRWDCPMSNSSLTTCETFPRRSMAHSMWFCVLEFFITYPESKAVSSFAPSPMFALG